MTDFNQDLSEIVRCPSCHHPIALTPDQDVTCAGCGARYAALPHSWALIPSGFRGIAHVDTWDALQANGLVSYVEDPEHNLSVTPRDDCLDFARFCAFHGRVLDIGCGIQPWPSYFPGGLSGVRYYGVDPLVGEHPADYPQLRAVSEFLPFAEGVFDHVTFATSLDHVLDPLRALAEARRVTKASGSIDIWVSSKSPDAPKPTKSNAWYDALSRPAAAEDVFHMKRLEIDHLMGFCRQLGMQTLKLDIIEVDPYRTRCFVSIR